MHRVDGPAIEAASGAKAWYQEGKLHRMKGPAVEGSDGVTEWYRHGIKIPDQDFIPKPFDSKKLAYVSGYYGKSVKVVENRILALRKDFFEEGETSRGVKPKW